MLNRIYLTLAFILLSLSWTQLSSAHEGRPVYIEIQEVTANTYKLRWKIPPVIESGAEPYIAMIGGGCKQLSGRVRPALTGAKQFKCEEPKISEGEAGDSQSQKTPVEQSPIEIALHYPGANPALSTLVQFETLEGEYFNVFNAPDVLRIPLPKSLSAWEVVEQYIVAGFEHILEGYDHLLFVLCLIQVAGSLRRILITITGFTIAHSITLGLATLNIFKLRIDVVEVLIAFSIVMLAAEIVKAAFTGKKETLAWKYPATVAATFGLLHGFGFASALGELGLPQNMQVTALAFFNIGVELGQIFFVLVVLTLIAIVTKIFGRSKSSFDANVLPTAVIYVVGILSAYWFVERALGVVIA